MRREKDVGRDPERMVTRREEGRAFHREGPMVAKDLVWAIVVLTRGTKRAMPVQGAERSTSDRRRKMCMSASNGSSSLNRPIKSSAP